MSRFSWRKLVSSLSYLSKRPASIDELGQLVLVQQDLLGIVR
jgi:hypothetical protein